MYKICDTCLYHLVIKYACSDRRHVVMPFNSDNNRTSLIPSLQSLCGEVSGDIGMVYTSLVTRSMYYIKHENHRARSTRFKLAIAEAMPFNCSTRGGGAKVLYSNWNLKFFLKTHAGGDDKLWIQFVIRQIYHKININESTIQLVWA